MKKLKLSLLDKEGAEVLTREQLKKIKGGGPGSGGGSDSPCREDGFVCYEQSGIQYRCFQDGWNNCCCGHDAGNDNCNAY